MIKRYVLSSQENASVRHLLEEAKAQWDGFDEMRVLSSAALYGQELPRSIREAFYALLLKETVPALLITNNPIEPEEIGPTPLRHWYHGESRPLNMAQILHGLYASLLGEAIGFATQQNGRVFNDLIPIAGAPHNASSGQGKVGLHTEDFSVTQPCMPDYLGLCCLRNLGKAQTTISAITEIEFPEGLKHYLFDTVAPYKSGLKQTVLFGSYERPYLRFGSVDNNKCTLEMREALDQLSHLLNGSQQSVILQPGDCLYFDNFLAVHGRLPFAAEDQPNGRWLSRLCVLRDLRRIRSSKEAPEDRVMLRLAVPGTR